MSKKHRYIIRTVVCAFVSIMWMNTAFAQSPDATANQASGPDNQAAAAASKQAANPLASAWLWQFQENSTWVEMPANGGHRVQSNLQFQPLVSAKLTDNWTLVSRPVLQLFNSAPYVDQAGQARRVTGFGDMILAFAVSPGHKLVGNWLLAAGPTFILPTATKSLLGQHKWQAGPTAAVGYVGKHFITYVFPQQWFSIGGSGRTTSQMSMQYAFVYFLKDGWSVGTNPNLLVNWKATSGNRVTSPIGLQVGKLRKIGHTPVKFDVQVQYYAVRPDVFGPKWNVQLQVTPIMPSLIKRKLL